MEIAGKNSGHLKLLIFPIIAFVIFAQPAFAEDIYVNVSWMNEAGGSATLINNLLDGDPNTFGLNGIEDAKPGDTVHFDSGLYQLPFDRTFFRSNIDGINLFGAGTDLTIFRGPSTESGLIWEIKGENITIAHFSMEFSRIGLKVDGDRPYDNVLLSDIISNELDMHYMYDQQKAEYETVYPSIFVEYLQIYGGTSAFQWNEKNEIVTQNDKYMEGQNIFINGTGNGIVPPRIVQNGHVIEVKGADWRNSLFMNMEAPFIPSVYEGLPRGRLGDSAPSFCGESNIVHETFYELGIGVGNWEENDPSAFLDENGRPIWNSVATGSQYRDRKTGKFIGYVGAIPPFSFPFKSVR